MADNSRDLLLATITACLVVLLQAVTARIVRRLKERRKKDEPV